MMEYGTEKNYIEIAVFLNFEQWPSRGGKLKWKQKHKYK